MSDKVIHRNKRRGRFVAIGPWNRPVSCGIRIMIRDRACWSRPGGLWFWIVDDGREVTKTIGESWQEASRRSVVVSACIAERDRETIPVMIVSGGLSGTATERHDLSVSIFPAGSLASTYKTEDAVEYGEGWTG